MAISQEQVDAWFAANPNATADEVAAAVQSVGGLDANEGLSGMIANRYSIAEPEVTNYYNAFATPAAVEAPAADLPTFTDAIVNTPTSQDDFLSTISTPAAPVTPVTPVIADVLAPTTPKPSDADIVKFFTDNPTVDDTTIAGLMDTLGVKPADIARATGANINDITNRYAAVTDGGETPGLGVPAKPATAATDTAAADKLKQQILGQNLTTKWQGEGFGSAEANAADMAKIMAGIGITDINQFGLIDKPVQVEVREDGKGGYVDVRTGKPVDPSTVTAQVVGGEGSDTTVFYGQGTKQVYGNKATGQEVPNTYSERQVDNAFGGTYAGKGNTAYRVQFDKAGNPVFYTTGASSSDIADWGPILALASVIPSPLQPFAIAANAAVSINNGDVLGGIASLAGLAGFSDVAAGARIAKAVESKDPFAIVTSVMNSPFAPNIGNTMLTDTISLKDASSAVNITNSLARKDYTGAISAAATLTSSPDVKLAAAAARFIKAAETNNFAGMFTAASGFDSALQAANKVTDKNVASQIANSVADANSAATAGTQLAALGTGTTSDAGSGVTLTGAGGETLQFPDLTSSPTILSDVALFNKGLGSLDDDVDEVDLGGGSTTIDTGGGSGVDTGGGSTIDTGGGTSTIDTGGGSTTVDTGGGGSTTVDTGGGGSTTVDTGGTSTVIDTTGLDEGPVIPAGGTGTVIDTTGLDEGPIIPGDDDDDIGLNTVCGAGMTFNTATGECEVNKDTVIVKGGREKCPIGTKLNLETGDCDPDWDETGVECADGFHDDGTGFCVADDDKGVVECEAGQVRDLTTGECVWPKVECEAGFHDDGTGFCVADDDKPPTDCPDGKIRDLETGECVFPPIICPEGKVLNEAGTACIDQTIITAKRDPCPTGTVYDEELDKCVPIAVEDKPCDPGFHKNDIGLCVADDDEECKPGFEKVGDKCEPVCKEGYIRNLATGVCEKVDTKECPPGQVKNAEGKCVPVTKVTPPTPPVVIPPPKKVVLPSFEPSTGSYVSAEKTDPIYASGIDDFDLFATLEELLADTSSKKANKKSKDKTKMATGGHLDDLLAEQMTVDDLLKLLR